MLMEYYNKQTDEEVGKKVFNCIMRGKSEESRKARQSKKINYAEEEQKESEVKKTPPQPKTKVIAKQSKFTVQRKGSK